MMKMVVGWVRIYKAEICGAAGNVHNIKIIEYDKGQPLNVKVRSLQKEGWMVDLGSIKLLGETEVRKGEKYSEACDRLIRRLKAEGKWE